MGDGEAEWIGLRALRQDGSKEQYLSVSLGAAGKLIEQFEPEQQVKVRVLDDNTVEIKPLNESKSN